MSAGIILTTQFTVPTAKSFTNYLSYLTREQALLEKNYRTPDEDTELSIVQSYLNETLIEKGRTLSSFEHRKNLKGIELKAKEMLSDTSSVNDDFTKYVTYMAREYALEQKKNLSTAELEELKKVKEKMIEYDPTPRETNKTLHGVFSNSKDELTKNDLPELSKLFASGQKNGSILFQDVVSHENEFLAELGLYDPITDTLNEQALIHAGTEMMNDLMKKEGLSDTGFWMGSIHRNTKHIHIHFALSEVKNTREPKKVKEEGIEYLQPKGVRKQSTLDSMKATYGRELRDYALGNERIKKLERKNDLRNELTKGIKQDLYSSKVELKLLNEIYQELPVKKSQWNYGTQDKSQLSTEVRDKIDTLTHSLVEGNDNYKEYMNLIQEEQKMKIKMFGKTTQKEKDQLNNELFNIKKRLGNSLLTELKKQDYHYFEKNNEFNNARTNLIFQLKNNQREFNPNSSKQESQNKSVVSKNANREPPNTKKIARQHKAYKRPLLTNYNLNKMKHTLNKVTDKRKEMYEHDLMKRRIEIAQQNR